MKRLNLIMFSIFIVALNFITAIFHEAYSQGTPAAWWNSDWKYRKALVFNNSAQAENLSDFPVLVVLNSGRVNYANTQNSGQDIRFIDANGTTILPYEIEKWNESGSSYIWVKVPRVDASSSTDSIWMYWGNTGISEGQNKVNVWDANYSVTLHMNETGGTTVYDSKNVNNGAATGGITTTTGKVSSGLSFNGSSQYIDWGSITGISTGNQIHTIEAWINPINSTPDPRQWIMVLGQEGDGAHHWLISNTSGSQFGVWEGTQTYPALPSGSWTHIALTNDGLLLNLFVNGILVTSESATFNFTSTALTLAKMYNTEAYYNGYLDEFRLSSNARSPAWVSAQYKSMTDAYVTFRPEENCLDPFPPNNVKNLSVSNITQSSLILAWTKSDSADAVMTWIVLRRDGVYPTGINDPNAFKKDSVTSVTTTRFLSGLPDNTAFKIGLFVRDAVPNWSPATAVSQYSATTLDGKPGNPLVFAINNITATSIQYHINNGSRLPSDVNRTFVWISEFKTDITSRMTNVSDSILTSDLATLRTKSGLTVGTKYYIGVIPRDNNGLWSDSVILDSTSTTLTNPITLTLSSDANKGEVYVKFNNTTAIGNSIDRIYVYYKAVGL